MNRGKIRFHLSQRSLHFLHTPYVGPKDIRNFYRNFPVDTGKVRDNKRVEEKEEDRG